MKICRKKDRYYFEMLSILVLKLNVQDFLFVEYVIYNIWIINAKVDEQEYGIIPFDTSDDFRLKVLKVKKSTFKECIESWCGRYS